MSLILRRQRPTKPTTVDPFLRVSPHFVLADFLGNHSVYSRGLRNMMPIDYSTDMKLANLRALCTRALEPIMAKWGGLSVSYGYIASEVSREIVKYQDPYKPSHHRFDLGAAADICVHRWVQDEFVTLEDLFLPESARSSPIALAHGIDQEGIPYSRLITYSESPYICIAVSAEEVEKDQPRKAFYENRYQGNKGFKPEYIQLSNQRARNTHFEQLQRLGLEAPWRGHGYPTYHGGGRRQFQHMRVSKYTMVSDFLFDLKSISTGEKNIPALSYGDVEDSFAAAGLVYDWLIVHLEIPRASIVSGYVSHHSRFMDPENDWRERHIRMELLLPDSVTPAHLAFLPGSAPSGVDFNWSKGNRLTVRIDKEAVLADDSWEVAV